MNKLTNAFAPKALIPTITCSDPDLETTRTLILALQEGGADIIGLVFPFSDPTTLSPGMQAATERALKSGATADGILRMLESMKEAGEITAPLIALTYAQIVFAYGVERFASAAERIGIDGVMLYDVPLEESEEFAGPLGAHGVDLLATVAASSGARVEPIARSASGFLYCMSTPGPGSLEQFSEEAQALVAQAKAANDALPCVVNFGPATPENIAEHVRYADGVMIDEDLAALIKRDSSQAPAAITALIRSLKEALA